MPEQPPEPPEEMETTTNVLDFPRVTERINGIRTHLGAMSLAELEQVERHVLHRIDDAQVDLYIIRDYMALHQREGA